MTLEREQKDDSDRADVQRQRELYESLPEPDPEEYPYPDLDDLERTPAEEFYDS